MAEPYLFPVSILKDIEPWLTEYFAYQRFLEKPRDFDPFGHAGLSPLVTI